MGPRRGQARDGRACLHPYLARWSGLPLALRRALAFALPLAMFALLLYLLLRPPDRAGGQDDIASEMTQTALALATAGE